MKRKTKEAVKKEFVPEAVSEGVVRDEEKQNPIDGLLLADEEKVRAPGNWKKVTYEELIQLEASGNLLGYDPSTGEALIKEAK